MGDFLMPALGADMDSGTIVEWRVGPGDVVHRGDVIAVIDTEKSDIDAEVFEDGVVEEVLVPVGTEVPVGTPLARVGRIPTTAGVAAPAAPAPGEAAVERAPAAGSTTPADDAGRTAAGRHVRASPRARREAARRRIDLVSLRGSGPDGAVLTSDLTAESGRTAPASPAPSGSAVPADPAESRRRAVGALMARSKREIPHFYLAHTIDLHQAMSWLAVENERRPVSERLLPVALLLKATALAAREVPRLNGSWDGSFLPSPDVHLGVAVSLRGGGLVAPAIHDADRLSLDDLMRALRELVSRARVGRLRSSEMTDPTLTVTNLGERGADEVLAVIYPPQVALVGFGRVVDQPVVLAGAVVARPTVHATLAADHRVTDGHEGSRFLVAVDRLLQTPEDL